MLPRLLCENLCSLNPDVERLAFSTFFEMTEKGILVENQKVWYGRTVIKSCAKLVTKVLPECIVAYQFSVNENSP